MNRYWCLERLKIKNPRPRASTKHKPKTSDKNLTRRKMAKIFDKAICKP